MSAILCEEDEAAVLTNETIEVHLSYLRAGFETVQDALPILRDKIDQLSEKVDSKIEALNISLSEKIEKANEQRIAGDAALGQRIDAVNSSLCQRIETVNTSLGQRIDALNTSLGDRIEKANEERIAGDAALGQKIDKLSDRMSQACEDLAQVKGHVNAVLWVFSGSSIIGVAVWIAKTLDWI